MEGEYVVMLGLIHTCTTLRYKPAFISTWKKSPAGAKGD